ncbi:YqaA family protein [Chloroflexota bacterium]
MATENSPKNARQKRNVVFFVLLLILVIAISATLHFVFVLHPERLEQLKNYVYLGAFLISIIGNATLIFPGAVLVILSNMSIVMYPSIGMAAPIVIGLVGAAGATIGELTGYALGYGGSAVIKNNRLYDRLVRWLSRWGTPTIIVLSIIPVFFDLVGIAAGALRYPLWKFLLFCWMGRTILYVVMCLAVIFGYRGILFLFS